MRPQMVPSGGPTFGLLTGDLRLIMFACLVPTMTGLGEYVSLANEHASALELFECLVEPSVEVLGALADGRALLAATGGYDE